MPIKFRTNDASIATDILAYCDETFTLTVNDEFGMKTFYIATHFGKVAEITSTRDEHMFRQIVYNCQTDTFEEFKIPNSFKKYKWGSGYDIPEAIQEKFFAWKDATKIAKGKLVEVYKGRKVPIGTKGYVFWIAAEPDSYGNRNIGIAPDLSKKNGTKYENALFVNIANCRVTDE